MIKHLNLALISGAILLLLSSCATTKNNINVDSDDVKFVQINEDSGFITANIGYPEIRDLSTLNKAVKDFVSKEYTAFQEKVREDENYLETKNEFVITSEVTTSKDIVSVLLTIYKYNNGANGATTLKSFNYDTKNDAFLNIIQASGYSYDELSEITRGYLLKPFASDSLDTIPKSNIDELKDMIMQGTKPDKESFKTFILSNDVVIIYFEPGTIGPYSSGIETVLVKIKE